MSDCSLPATRPRFDSPVPAQAGGAAAMAGLAVIVVSHGFQPNYERGFVNGLAANGARPTLIASDRSDVAHLLPGVQAVNLRGSQDSARPAWRKAANLALYHLRLMAHTLRRRRSIVHVTGLLQPVVWGGLLQGLWFRLFSARYVLTVHNLLPHDRHHRLNRRLYALAYRLPQALVVHTAAMKRELVGQMRVPAERVHVMEHGIEPVPPGVTPPPLPSEGPLQLLFFGALLPYKGLDLLLDALAQPGLPAWRLHIAGPCVDAALRRETEARIAAHPHRGAIRWTCGFVPEDDVPRLFAGAELLVLPYRHIDQSGVLFQALRHGLPVLATDVGSFRDYVGPDVGQVCPPGSAQALALALQRHAAQRGRYVRQRICELGKGYEWPQVSRVLAAAYAADDRTGLR